jgi:hypothetical protein
MEAGLMDSEMVHVMSRAQAEDWKARISATASQLRILLFEGYQRRAWEPLGYATWTDCLKALAEEYRFSERRLWQLHAANQVEQTITEPGSVGAIPERSLRPLTALPPDEQREAWRAAVETSQTEKPTSVQVTQAVQAVRTRVAPVDDQTLLRIFPWLARPSESQAMRAALAICARDPMCQKYEAAVREGLVVAWIPGRYAGGHCETLTQALAHAERWPGATKDGQVFLWANPERPSLPGLPPWPKYTGMRPGGMHGTWYLPDEHKKGQEALAAIPLFTEDEWAELSAFDAVDVLSSVFPEINWSQHRQGLAVVNPSPHDRRTYDHSYGRLIAETTCELCTRHFVRRGWGQWGIVIFNDGMGGRITRRYFEQDWYGANLIAEARATADPEYFSAWQYDRLAIHAVQQVKMGWSAIRKETLPRAEVLEALRADLAALEAEGPLTSEQIDERTLDILQDLTFDLDHEGREGRATVRCLDDGTIDPDDLKARRDAANKSDEARWRRRQQPQFEHTFEWIRPARRNWQP